MPPLPGPAQRSPAQPSPRAPPSETRKSGLATGRAHAQTPQSACASDLRAKSEAERFTQARTSGGGGENAWAPVEQVCVRGATDEDEAGRDARARGKLAVGPGRPQGARSPGRRSAGLHQEDTMTDPAATSWHLCGEERGEGGWAARGDRSSPRSPQRPEGLRLTGAASPTPFLHLRPHFRSSEAFGPPLSGPDRSARSALQSRPALGPDPHPRILAPIFLPGPAPVPSSAFPAPPRSEPTAHHSPTPAPSSYPALATFLKAPPFYSFAPF